MGLGSTDIELFIKLAKSGDIERGSAVAEIGEQQLSDDFPQSGEAPDASLLYIAYLVDAMEDHGRPSNL